MAFKIYRFTDWLPYSHKVKALLSNGQFVTLPVNIETINIVGKDNLLDTFFRPYSQKMWGLPLEKLDPEIINRVPTRNDMNELYFPNDFFQALPAKGYTHLFNNILNHKNIKVSLNTEFSRLMELSYRHIFNSMPIDEYYDFELGRLPYRSIKFHSYDLPISQLLPVATVNFTHNEKYTRVTEWKHLPGNVFSNHTTLTFEEPCSYTDNFFERYYPVKDIDGFNQSLYNKYKSLPIKNHTFIGRCGLYKYLDMHQAISLGFKVASNFLRNPL